MKKIKVGILGVGGRGKAFHKNVLANNGEIVAACDISEEYLKKAKEKWGEQVATYTSFDEMLEHKGLDLVVLSNYFHEHAPYAIKALNKNIHVLSECTSNATMAEGVALVRAAEQILVDAAFLRGQLDQLVIVIVDAKALGQHFSDGTTAAAEAAGNGDGKVRHSSSPCSR